jgi:LuxR family maltose regulon positive regulatory protein
MVRVVELLVLQSLAYQGKKDISAAVTTLALAVSLAQPDGYKRVFLDEGELVAKLLYLVKSHPDTAGYASEMLEAVGPVSGPVSYRLSLDRAAERARNRSPSLS